MFDPTHPMTTTARIARGALLCAAAGLALSGCLIVDDHDHDDSDHHDDNVYTEPFYTTIDADQTLGTTLGQGAGFFVEYRSGGTWYLWTSCDTDVTGRSCNFEAHLAASSTIRNLTGVGLESYDGFEVSGPRTVTFSANTASQMDGVQFETDPGESLELEVYLDGYLSPDYIFWFGDGQLNEGAPWSPVVFEPNTTD